VESVLKTSVSPDCYAPPLQAVAFYAAIVSLTVERSTFGLNLGVEQSQLIAAIETPSSLAPVPWPPRHAETQDDITLLALTKLEATFASPRYIPNCADDEIVRITYAHFPVVEPTREASPLPYKRFRVKACILTNGDAVWTYETPRSGDFPPGVRTGMEESDVAAYIRNLVTSDLKCRITRRQFIIANRF
jgi:hypothetical protein